MEKMFTPEIFIQERDIIETEEGNKELRDIQIKIEEEQNRKKNTRTYKFFNFFSKLFLRRDTTYKTKEEKMLLNQLNNKIMDLSGPFSNAARNIEQQIKKTEQLSKDIAIRQEKNVGINRNL